MRAGKGHPVYRVTRICNYGKSSLVDQVKDAKVEEAIRTLITVRNKPRLDSSDIKTAEPLLVFLRRQKGYSPEQISNMTQGKWNVSTIKHYTKGVKTGSESGSSPNNSLGIVGDMAARGISLDEVQETTLITKKLDAQSVSIDEVSQVIADCNAFGIPIRTLVSIVTQLKKSGIPIGEIEQLHSYRASLEKLGINTKMAGQMVEAATHTGGFERTMQSIRDYGKDWSVQSELKSHSIELENANKQLIMVQKKTQKLEEKATKFESQIARIDRLESKGFNETTLLKLEESCKLYGGPTQVFNAINRFGTLEDLNKLVRETELKLRELQAKFDKLSADHIHLADLIAMCNELLQLKFTIVAIQQVYDNAKKYGEPLEVLKAISEYGQVSEIKKDVEVQFRLQSTLRVQNKELEGTLSNLRGVVPIIEAQLIKTLQTMNNKLSVAAENGAANIETVLTMEAGKLRKEINSFADTMKKMGALEDDLQIAKIVQTVTKYPIDSDDLPLRYASLFLELALKVLRVKGADLPLNEGSSPSIQQTIEWILKLLNPSRRNVAV